MVVVVENPSRLASSVKVLEFSFTYPFCVTVLDYQ